MSHLGDYLEASARVEKAEKRAERLVALLRYTLPFIQHCNDCGAYRDNDAAPLIRRICAALGEK
jgi:hypothetical protein